VDGRGRSLRGALRKRPLHEPDSHWLTYWSYSMFTRDSRPGRIDTLIGKAAHLEGDLEFEGGLHLDGRIGGDVRALHPPAHASSLSVSETGVIDGAVEVADVELRGTVRGDIRASARLVLGPTARVEGNVYYGVIEMALGAQIMGKLIRLQPQASAADSSLDQAL
jgi:cytoskeletal protein CcmA (bactofilin family)